MFAEVSFNVIVISDLEENFPETMARSGGEERKKIWKAVIQEKKWKMP